FLADPGVPDGQAVQTIILNNAAFQTEDLDTYDFDCDDISNAQAILMANISNYGSDVILEEKANKERNNESVTAELERYKERIKTFEQRLNIDLSSREKMIDSQTDDMIREKFALKEQVDSLEQSISKQFKEKECLLQTFIVFKSESKEKEDKYIENEIDLEKKIKDLDNIIFKVCQSAQTVHIKHSDASPVKIEAPKELPKISLVNESLKKLKFHLARFNNVVKIKTTPDARTEVQTVFDQMDAALQQSSVSKQCLEIAKKKLLLENDRLLQQIMSQDVLLTMMNSKSLNGESCNKCFNLDAELLKSQNAHNDLLKSYSQLEKHYKVFVITSLKNDLRKLKGKEIVDIAAQTPSAYTIVPRMFKLDLEPLAPRLFQNRDAHIDYFKYTQEQANILRGIVEQTKAKQPLDNALDFAYKHAQRIQELLVYVRDTCPNANKLSAKKVVVTPKNNVKKVRIEVFY
ncbi:hypothetical protein Tco_0736609, partial [Tanacetum coccineum]